MNLTQVVDPFEMSGKQRFFTVYIDKDTGYIPQIVLTEGGVQGAIIASVLDYENKPARPPKHCYAAYTDENVAYFKNMQRKMIGKGYLPKDALLK